MTATAGFRNCTVNLDTDRTACLLNCCVDGEHTSRGHWPRDSDVHTLLEPGVILDIRDLHGDHPFSGNRARGRRFMVNVGSRRALVCIFEESPRRDGRNNTRYECKTASLECWMQHRGGPIAVRGDQDGTNRSNRMLDMWQGLPLDVHLTPPEAPWHLSVLGVVSQLIKRTATLYALGEGRRPSCSECLTMTCMANEADTHRFSCCSATNPNATNPNTRTS